MVSDDALRWDDKYQNQKHPQNLSPDPLLVKFQDLFGPDDIVVDLASGGGRHSLFLAERGCFVIPLDCSRVALNRSCFAANNRNLEVNPVLADLTEFRFPNECLDAVICFNYLNRAISENIIEALKPGGTFVMKTFNRNHLISNPRFNANYILQPGELAQLFAKLKPIYLDDDCKDFSIASSAIIASKR